MIGAALHDNAAKAASFRESSQALIDRQNEAKIMHANNISIRLPAARVAMKYRMIGRSSQG